MSLTPLRATVSALLFAAFLSGASFANHGPGTSGGGSSTASGETLKAGTWDATLRFDWTQFEGVSRAEAERRALSADEFDSLDRAILATVGLSYGITDDFQLGAQIGWYWGHDFISAEAGVTPAPTADPSGLTDLWINGKYRLFENHGHLSVIGGIKLPTGDDDEELSDGERLEASSQPGSGAVDWQAGLAWSRYLTPRMTLDTSAIYTWRGEHDDFTVGDRADLGVAVAYRLTESVKEFPNWGLFGEATAVWLGKDDDDGEKNDNSGGTTVYLSAGVRARLTERVAVTLAPALPVVQDLNGDQVEARWKLALALSFAF